MSEITLQAQTRTQKGRKTNVIRAEGLVPAVVYGDGTDPQSISVNRQEFIKVYRAAGESSIIELSVADAKPLNVLIHDYDLDPLRDEVIHIDFRSVDMNKPIEAVVTLEFVGEAAAVKTLGGTLMNSRETVLVRALPSKLVRSINVDLTQLATFDDVIRLVNLDLPEGMEIVGDTNLTIVSVSKPRTVAEMAALDEAEGEAPTEGEAPAEGEAAAEGEAPAEGEEKKAE
ncbi:MAG: 50S ribosomal protein L25 [Parcubacteria group bacterium]|nr:50S ribosomal protein L25 [Parcubacteria group bacterium]